MSVGETFEGCYEVADGYVGKRRPKFFKIYANQLDEDSSEEELEELYDELVEDHFRQNIFPSAERKEEFVQWAKEQIALRNGDSPEQ
jgi:hypothetical protein